MRIPLLRGIALAICLAFCVACSPAISNRSDNSRTDQLKLSGPADLAEFLGKTSSFDYDPLSSPEALRRSVDFAGYGSVESVTDATVSEGPTPVGAVMVRLALADTWKSSSAEPSDKSVYFFLRRPTNVDWTVISEALPTGTKIALFGYETKARFATGQPSGARVFEPAAQGLIIADRTDGTSFNVWGENENAALPKWQGAESIEGLRRALS